MKKTILMIIILVNSGSVIAQINNCIIPGFPGCTEQDFYRALKQQEQQNMQQQYLNEMRRNNQLMQEQLELQRQLQLQQQLQPNPYIQQHNQRCLIAPLLTPGC